MGEVSSRPTLLCSELPVLRPGLWEQEGLLTEYLSDPGILLMKPRSEMVSLGLEPKQREKKQ